MPPLTEAQKKAKAKYNSKVTKVSIEFYPQDEMLLFHLKHQENKQSYIKELIKKDMLNFKSVQSVKNERMIELGKRNYLKSEKDIQ